jgi:hypothetical protein
LKLEWDRDDGCYATAIQIEYSEDGLRSCFRSVIHLMEEKKLHIVDIVLPPSKTPDLFAKITVKPAYAVTCIKRSSFSCLVIESSICIEPLLRGHLSYKATFSLFQRWPLNTGLTIITFVINENVMEYLLSE